MKSIRIRNFASLLQCSLLIFGNTACKKDKEEDECVPPALETQIMTTWQATISNLLTIPIGFTANGELTGNLSSVLSELPMLSNIDDVIKYEVKSDTQIDLLATQDGAPLPTFTLNVTERDCEKINLAGEIGGKSYIINLTK